MKIHILSDIHNEFSVFSPLETDADVIVLAGDIGKSDQGIFWARRVFPHKEIVYVPGNHEFYGAQRLGAAAIMRIAARECGIHLLDDDEIIIDGVRFLGATLWTDFRLFSTNEHEIKLAMMQAQAEISDFRVVHEGLDGHFSPRHSVALHTASLKWLKTKLNEPFDGKTVVVTHHLPSVMSVADEFMVSLLPAAFASNLDFLFGKTNLWIHGHTHNSFDYTSNGTRIICNPRGYVTKYDAGNSEFNPSLVIEI
jgi:predicted phosphodiesterase